jgi:cell division protein FtsI (penicillin-binding protein 3)
MGISNHTQTEEEWVRASKTGNAVNWKKNVVAQNIVPDVSGMTFRDALFLLEKSGLKVFYEGKGRVASQSLSPGARISKGSKIFIRLNG